MVRVALPCTFLIVSENKHFAIWLICFSHEVCVPIFCPSVYIMVLISTGINFFVEINFILGRKPKTVYWTTKISLRKGGKKEKKASIG